jgi:MoaA/NifB/PqqE/SkfB family radical SAM enzyme
VTLFRRLLLAVRHNTLAGAIGFRLRQLAYANSHPGDHYLKLGDGTRRFTVRRSRAVLRRIVEQPMAFSIDVVSGCNLECPTCPVANWLKESWTGARGVMDATLLHQLLRKALSECLVGDISLFAYSEPLLHPRVAELVAIVKSYGLTCSISTNLNVMRDADALLLARPDRIMISVSGFHQHTYAVTHAGGNVEAVKSHLRVLADARDRLASKTAITVLFHKYRTNLDDLPLMKDFATSLGLAFEECWATFFPLEKVLTYAKPELALADITAADRGIIDRLAVPIEEAVELASRTPADSCALQDSAVVLDVTGNVYLCCEAAMDQTRNRIASYLDTPLQVVQARKKKHSLCTTCMAGGLPPVSLLWPGDRRHDPVRAI